MFPTGFRKRYWSAATALLILPLGLGSAYSVSRLSHPDPDMQQLADDAALASVQSLSSSQGQPDQARMDASIAAARAVVSRSQVALRSVSPSTDRMSATVVLAPPTTRAVSATARYLPPSEGNSSQAAVVLPPGEDLRAPL
jgi:hypothetical protein